MAVYNFIQAHLHTVNDDKPALRMSWQSAASNDEMQRRFTVSYQEINAVNQNIGTAMQAMEMKVSALSAVVASCGPA